MHSYFVYILKCADDSYYTGVTNDLNRRLIEHQSGNNLDSYTHRRRPVEIVFRREFKYIDQAIAFEKQVKGWGRKKKEALIDGNWNLLHPLAECLNHTSHKKYGKGVSVFPMPSSAQHDNASATFSATNALPLVSLSGAEDHQP